MFDFSTLTIALLVAAGFGGMFVFMRAVVEPSDSKKIATH